MNNFSAKTVIPLIMILASATLVWAQDWPQWRGAHRDGKLTGWVAPSSWPQALSKKWTMPVGLGDSSPVLAENRLYIHSRQDAEEVVSCIDPVNGTLLWQQAYPAEMVASGPSASHPGPRSTPVIVNGKLITLGIGGILSCFDAATGTLLWRKQSAADYLNTPYQFESSMSPIVVNDECIVYIGGDEQGALIGFSMADGQPRWKYSGGAPAPSSPMIMTVDGIPQIVTLSEKNVFAVSLQDHSLLWTNNSVRGPHASIVDAGSCLFALGINGELVAYQSNGEEYRQLAGYQVSAAEIWAHPLISEKRIYIRDKDSVTLWMIE
jgi:outer membrane protein assembly factor BamB